MSTKAKDLIKRIKENQKKAIEAEIEYTSVALAGLKKRAATAVKTMVQEGEFSTEVEVKEDETSAIEPLTNELRELGYKFCLIESQNEKKEVVQTRLRISVAHLA
jgi:hypothetical protein